jgi:hypothetical protein
MSSRHSAPSTFLLLRATARSSIVKPSGGMVAVTVSPSRRRACVAGDSTRARCVNGLRPSAAAALASVCGGVVDGYGCGYGTLAHSGYGPGRPRRLLWRQHNEVRSFPSLTPFNGLSQHAR